MSRDRDTEATCVKLFIIRERGKRLLVNKGNRGRGRGRGRGGDGGEGGRKKKLKFGNPHLGMVAKEADGIV